MAKINWIQATSDYVGDETQSYESIAKKYKVSKKAVSNHAVKNKWQLIRRETTLKVHQELPARLSISLTDVVARQLFVAHIMQAKAIEVLMRGQLTPKTIREVILCCKTGIDIERKALGIGNPQFIR